jgi:hypothetical protein
VGDNDRMEPEVISAEYLDALWAWVDAEIAKFSGGMVVAKKKAQQPVDQQLEDLCEELQKNPLPDGVLDDELHDACQSDAEQAYENIKESVLLEQITFLYERGYNIPRIREIVEEELEREDQEE